MVVTYRIRVIAERSIEVVLDKRDDALARQIALDEAVLDNPETRIEYVIQDEAGSEKAPANPPSSDIDFDVADELHHAAFSIPEQVCTDCRSHCDPVCLTCPSCGSYSLRSL